MYYLIPAVLLFLIAFLLVRTFLFARPPIPPEDVELPAVDVERLAVGLGEAVRCETVSTGEGAPPAAWELYKLHTQLQLRFPLAHARLKRESVNDFSLLYTWEGRQPDLPPVLFTSHQDVVPVDPTQLDAWQQRNPLFLSCLTQRFELLEIELVVIGDNAKSDARFLQRIDVVAVVEVVIARILEFAVRSGVQMKVSADPL